MPASITWTDAEGTSSLTNIDNLPNRFNAWTPDHNPIGPRAVGLGTGQTFTFAFRNDLTVALEIAPVPGASLELALRLKMHLLSRGQVSVSTGNFLASSFETCILAPGTVPQIEFTDRQMLEYTFSVVLKAGTGLTSTTGGSSIPFIPTSLEGMRLWLRGSSLLPTYGDFDFVSVWPDESGNNAHAIQATAGKFPRFRTNVINGHSVVRFDGTDDGMAVPITPSIGTSTPQTTFLVWANNSAATGIRSLVGGADQTLNRLTFGPWDALYRALIKFPGGGEFVDAGTATVGQFALIGYTRPTSDAGIANYYKDGTLVSSTSPGGLVGYGTQINLGMEGFGYGGAWPAPADADLAELMVWDRVLVTEELTQVWAYLSTKYGIAIGTSHTLLPGKGTLTATGFAPTVT